MKRLYLAMTAVSALVAVPAAAQYAQPNVNAGGTTGVQNRIGQLQTRFQAGLDQGTISRREARPLRQQMRTLVDLEASYRADGLTREERVDLRQRIRSLHEQIRVADGGAYDRYDRYVDRDDNDGAYAANDPNNRNSDRIDRNNDGFDDRDVDRDGRWDDDVPPARAVASNDRIDANRDGFDDRDVDRDGRWDDDVQAGRALASNDRVDVNRDGFDDRDIDRDGRWDDDVQAGRALASNDRIDRNNDGFDDRDVDRDGRWDDDVQAGRAIASNDRVDRNYDGWDDRDIDRDGRWDDDVAPTGYTGQGGPIEADGWVVDETGGRASGVPGLIGTFLGVGGLQVGQRASANLYAVPYEFREQFRDTSNVYFRSDGRRIYEIDARTQTVLRIYTREAE